MPAITVVAARAQLSFLLVALALAPSSPGQCTNPWVPGFAAAGTNGVVYASAVWDPDGSGPQSPCLVVGGTFTVAGGVPANHIARFDLATGVWSPFGSGTDAAVWDLAVLPNGDLVAGGQFLQAGGVAASCLARWGGTAWSPLGSGTNGTVLCVATMPNGDLVAGGYFTAAGGTPASHIARWDGSAWWPLGTGVNQLVWDLVPLPGGELMAGGWFTSAGGVAANHVAMWNGSAWSQLGAGLPGNVYCLVDSGLGVVLAGGEMPQVQLWDGLAWTSLQGTFNGSISRILTLADGSLVAAGGFSAVDGVAVHRIARSNGLPWQPFGAGTDAPVLALVELPNRDVVVGGSFTTADGAVAGGLAALTTTCLATAVAFGAGCSGSGGPNVLTAAALPWLDATFVGRATGMPAQALVLVLTGLSQIALPLPAVLAVGVPGCTALVSPDILGFVLPTAGVAQSSLLLPNSPGMLGLVFYHQMAPIEVDGNGAFVAFTSTNALTLTVGRF